MEPVCSKILVPSYQPAGCHNQENLSCRPNFLTSKYFAISTLSKLHGAESLRSQQLHGYLKIPKIVGNVKLCYNVMSPPLVVLHFHIHIQICEGRKGGGGFFLCLKNYMLLRLNTSWNVFKNNMMCL
jgi:hypothetical protein